MDTSTAMHITPKRGARISNESDAFLHPGPTPAGDRGRETLPCQAGIHMFSVSGAWVHVVRCVPLENAQSPGSMITPAL